MVTHFERSSTDGLKLNLVELSAQSGAENPNGTTRLGVTAQLDVENLSQIDGLSELAMDPAVPRDDVDVVKSSSQPRPRSCSSSGGQVCQVGINTSTFFHTD